DPGVDDLRDPSGLRAEQDVLGQERRIGVALVQVLEDRDRLGEADRVAPLADLEHRHLAQQVHLAVRRRVLLAAVGQEVDRLVLVLEAFVVEPDPHAPRRGAPPETVELEAIDHHGCALYAARTSSSERRPMYSSTSAGAMCRSLAKSNSRGLPSPKVILMIADSRTSSSERAWSPSFSLSESPTSPSSACWPF